MTTAPSSPSPDFVARAQSGDAAARDQLVREMLPFIRYVARARLSRAPTEDAIQDGVGGLLEALKRYKPGGQKTFKWFAFYFIMGEMRKGFEDDGAFRSRWETNQLDDLEQPACADFGVNLDCLTEQQREVVQSHFGLNGEPERTASEIAASLGLTSARVRQVLQSALGRLQHLLARD